MALQLAREEPEAGPWRVESLTAVVEALTQSRSGHVVSGRPFILAVDGRSNAGKTTLAARIGAAVPGSTVVHTDDIAWEHSRFGWSDLLVDGVLVPVRQGHAVSYRPPRWAEHGRAGSIDVPADCSLLVIEGDGAGRREVGHLIDALIWVQSDENEAARRGRARAAHADAIDGANRPADGSPPDDAAWMAEEVPFNSDQRTWQRADLVVCGTPQIAWDPATQVVVAGPRAVAGAGDRPDRVVLGRGRPGFEHQRVALRSAVTRP